MVRYLRRMTEYVQHGSTTNDYNNVTYGVVGVFFDCIFLSSDTSHTLRFIDLFQSRVKGIDRWDYL